MITRTSIKYPEITGWAGMPPASAVGRIQSSKVADRLEEAKAAVAMWREGVHSWQNAMEHLATEQVSPEGVEWFVEKFQPMPPNPLVTDRVRDNVETARGELRSILASETQEGINQTAFGLFQAGIEWSQHWRQARGRDERTRMESHFRRSMMSGASLRRSILKLAQEAVTV